MKKAKIMMTAIAVLGIAGGALAFKASKAYTDVVYTTAVINQTGSPVDATITDLANRTSNTRVFVTFTPTAQATVYTYIAPSL